MSALYEKYRARGFMVVACPCNQFLGQEPGTEAEIQHAVCTRFPKAEFPIVTKLDVNGDNAHPLWTFLKSKKSNFFGAGTILWNFSSFLCTPDGQVHERYAPGIPFDAIEADLLRILPAAPPANVDTVWNAAAQAGGGAAAEAAPAAPVAPAAAPAPTAAPPTDGPASAP